MTTISDILQANILIVDDQLANVKLLEHMLRRGGYTNVSAEMDARAVVSLHAANHYDLILLDLNMPHVSGFQVLEELKQVEMAGYLCVLVVTAEPGHKLRALSAGARDFISKPFDQLELMTRIRNTLEIRLLHLAARNFGSAQEQLVRERTAGLHRAQLVARMAHVVSGPDGRFDSWSATLPTLTGLAEAQMPSSIRAWLALVDPADRERFRATCISAGKCGERMELDYRIRRGDGSVIQVHQVLEPLQGKADANGREHWFHTIQDITEQREQQLRIARLSQIYAMLSGINAAIVRIRNRDELLQEACRVAVTHGAFSMAWAGVLDQDSQEGKVVAWYGGEAGYVEQIRFTGRAGEAGSGRPASVAVRVGHNVICNDIGIDPSLTALRDDLLQRGHRSLAALPILVDQRAEAVIVLFADEVDFFTHADRLRLLDELIGDLSLGLQFIAKEERLHYLAYYDALTGLPNRTLFSDRLTQALHASAADSCMAVVAINVANFSHLNDALGRHAGDALLRQLAQRLQASLGDRHLLCRQGADTYAICFDGLKQGADAAALLERYVLQPLVEPFIVGPQEVRLAVRAGIALSPSDGSNAETLFKHAEVALKQAKASNDLFLYYSPPMNAAIAARIALETGLRSALAAQQFEMYYQPRVDLLSGHLVSAEALIRWHHPQRGLVPPVEFIPLAEETGLIVAIGAWVIDAVCAQQAAWQAQGVEIVPVAINLSALQLRKGHVQRAIHEALDRHGLQPQYLECELTESVVMEDPQDAARQLQALKNLGIRLSLDDFGTGYSSLAYLKRFPFDFVKIDRSFISDVTNSVEDAAIATAVIAMAHSLGLRVVAEGVETAGQLRFLRQHRCDEMQGYYFSRPVPAPAFSAMLDQHMRLALAPEPAQREDTLLIVDDEPNNLSTLRRLLRNEGYRVLVAGSGEQGLELLALNSVQVILSDQRMPGMSGARFLGVAKDLYPDTVRMILSGYTDLDAVTASINEGAVFKFITKPWDDQALREHIRDAFRHYRPYAHA